MRRLAKSKILKKKNIVKKLKWKKMKTGDAETFSYLFLLLFLSIMSIYYNNLWIFILSLGSTFIIFKLKIPYYKYYKLKEVKATTNGSTKRAKTSSRRIKNGKTKI